MFFCMFRFASTFKTNVAVASPDIGLLPSPYFDMPRRLMALWPTATVKLVLKPVAFTSGLETESVEPLCLNFGGPIKRSTIHTGLRKTECIGICLESQAFHCSHSFDLAYGFQMVSASCSA